VSETLKVTIYARAEPQGSARAFVVGGKARITSDNKKLKPFRSELAQMALAELGDRPQPLFGKHEPVSVSIIFCFQRPPSAKKRTHPVVKPDIDKVARSVNDSLTGIAFHDDAQIVQMTMDKRYATCDCVIVEVRRAE
jgi:Holliday junction resolvase RusA-like endonuclease